MSETGAREIKQVIVMRKDLGMRKGKMIAQGAHASMRVILEAGRAVDPTTYSITMTEAMATWLTGRFAKICVGVSSEAELDEIMDKARAAGLPCAVIIDAGRTEFHGVPTKTCGAIGPAYVDEIDPITGALPLL